MTAGMRVSWLRLKRCLVKFVTNIFNFSRREGREQAYTAVQLCWERQAELGVQSCPEVHQFLYADICRIKTSKQTGKATVRGVYFKYAE